MCKGVGTLLLSDELVRCVCVCVPMHAYVFKEMYFINWLPVQCPDRSQDIQQRKRYVAMVDNVRENGGDVKIFSSLHVSGEREWGFFILGPGTVRV